MSAGYARIKQRVLEVMGEEGEVVMEYIDEIKSDGNRLDWLADPKNEQGNVTLPFQCVENNIDSLRCAIDEAMNLRGDQC